MPEPAVVTRALTVSFGDVAAVRGLDLSVAAGRATALVGRNGAGKSTTLKVLAGVVPATSGDVRVAGADVRHSPIHAKRLTGYCPDVGGLVPRATPWEHLQLAARLRRMHSGWPERARDLLTRFDLADASDRVTAGFSHGMSRRMSVLLASFHEPPVLLLDEPFDGVDPFGVDATMKVVREAIDAGRTVLISTHLLDLATEVCDDAVVLRAGQAVSRSAAAELRGEIGRQRYRELLT